MKFHVGSMEFYPSSFHGVSVRAQRASIYGISIEFHGDAMDAMPCQSVHGDSSEILWSFRGVLWNFHELLWNSMEFPWSSMEFLCSSMEFP